MKTTLEFSHREEHEAKRCINADVAWSVIWEWESHLRTIWKYSEDDSVQIDDLWQHWNLIKEDNGIGIDDALVDGRPRRPWWRFGGKR